MIELLVVISIIALLIALMLPALSSARRTARTMVCLNNLGQIAIMANSYSQDYGQQLPPASISVSYTTNVNPSALVGAWPQFLDGYVTGTKVTISSDLMKVFNCGNVSVNAGRWHYSAPRRVMVALSVATDMPYKLARVVRPSEIILAADGTQNLTYADTDVRYARAGERFSDAVSPLSPGNPANAYYDPSNPVMDLPIAGSTEPNFEDVGGATNGLVRWRHGADTAANSSFIDGHAETRKMGVILNRNMRPD